MGRRTCVVFDFGGVIGRAQDPAFFETAARLSGVDSMEGGAAAMREAYRYLREGYDRGTLDGRSYWMSVLARVGAGPEAPIEELIRLDTGSWTTLNRDVIELMQELRRSGMRMGILSNMPPDMAMWVREECGWILEMLANVTFSCDVGAVKPEPAIYAAALRGLGLPAESCLFVDDTPANVAAARQLGMGGVLFRTVSDIQAGLAAG